MLTDFPSKKPYNPGGYNAFQFIPYYNVEAYPMIANSQVLVPLELSPGAAWLTGYATMETLSYDEAPQRDEAGPYYTLTVSGFVPGDTQGLIDLVHQMQSQRFIVLVHDSLGKQRLVGTPRAPLDFAAAFGSGKMRADQKGFNITFSGVSTFPSPVYEVV